MRLRHSSILIGAPLGSWCFLGHRRDDCASPALPANMDKDQHRTLGQMHGVHTESQGGNRLQSLDPKSARNSCDETSFLDRFNQIMD